MGLSRKAWNNVVIFAMLIMIFFLNGLHHRLNPTTSTSGTQRLLPEQTFVLTVAYPGFKIERIGTSWRSEGEFDMNVAALPLLVDAWQHVSLEVADVTLPSRQAISVAQFWLAGEELPWSFQLYQDKAQYYIFDKQQQSWLILPNELAYQLFAPLNLANNETNHTSEVTN